MNFVTLQNGVQKFLLLSVIRIRKVKFGSFRWFFNFLVIVHILLWGNPL
jgi:hypothetical protein